MIKGTRDLKAGRDSVTALYEKLKRQALMFEFRPGDRLNEIALARQMGVSRTPLREALSRLATDGLLTFAPNHGFSRTPLEVKEVFDLYEFRLVLEVKAARLAVERGSDEAIEKVALFLDHCGENHPERTVNDLVAIDEEFHVMIMALNGNCEMLQSLRGINARIRYVRVDERVRDEAPTKHEEHRAIVEALRARDARRCADLLHLHIEHRMDQIVDAVKRCYGRIYVPN